MTEAENSIVCCIHCGKRTTGSWSPEGTYWYHTDTGVIPCATERGAVYFGKVAERADPVVKVGEVTVSRQMFQEVGRYD